MLHDKDIREPLFDFLEESYGKTRIIEEKTMGKSRADVVCVTEEALFGVEIKSDADTYARLTSQVKDYDKYYDYNYVVVGTSHALHIREHVPEYWGVITVEVPEQDKNTTNSVQNLDFYILRRPSKNPNVRLAHQLEIFWKTELAKLQEYFDMPKYKDKSRSFIAQKFEERVEANKLDERELKKQMSYLLFERDYSTIEEELKEYRKGELAKKLEIETDPVKQFELMAARDAAIRNLRKRSTSRKRRRR